MNRGLQEWAKSIRALIMIVLLPFQLIGQALHVVLQIMTVVLKILTWVFASSKKKCS